MATPANSPCAPAIGARLTAGHAGDVLEDLLQLEQAGEKTLPRLVRRARDGARGTAAACASALHARGLYFMVHEPSG